MELSRIWLESLSWADHVVVVLFAVVLPTISTLRWPRRKQLLREDRPGIRPKLYRSTIVTQWILSALALWAWFGQGRTAGSLGLGWAGGIWAWVVAALVVALLLLMTRQAPAIGRSPELAEQFLEQVDEQAPFLPRDTSEFRLFILVAITAGLCEELLYRGYLMRYLGSVMGAWALPVHALAFGLAHAYQGPKGVLKTFVAGLLLGALTLGSGSLWPSVVLHAFTDFNAARVFRAARRAGGSESGGP